VLCTCEAKLRNSKNLSSNTNQKCLHMKHFTYATSTPSIHISLPVQYWPPRSIRPWISWYQISHRQSSNISHQNSISMKTELLDMPIIQITATTHSFVKKVWLFFDKLTCAVCVSPAVIQELKRIVKESEIMKYGILQMRRNERKLTGSGKMIRNGQWGTRMDARNLRSVLAQSTFRLRYAYWF
jgi:hypothetical protein